MRNLWLYGPPGSGKTTLGGILAERLSLPFADLDRVLTDEAGQSVAAIFAAEGEAGFRAREKRALSRLAARGGTVVALGGGALLDPESRRTAEASGPVACLACDEAELVRRIVRTPGQRPLVAGAADAAAARLHALLAARRDHYAAFARQLDTSNWDPEALADRAEALFGAFRIDAGDRPSRIAITADGLDSLGFYAQSCGLTGKCTVVADAHTAPLYGTRVAAALAAAGYGVTQVTIPAGEPTKNLDTVQTIWRAFLSAGLGRGDFAVAVGGGVTGDLTGFAAATWMRGIRWVNVPTTLLAMVDASVGGKTGCDLPEGKNLLGAFHSPELVFADVTTLRTLPAHEWRCGLAESVKHALIGDPALTDALETFAFVRDLADGDCPQATGDAAVWADAIARSLAVKVRIVRADPRERGERAKLNLGHTVGHAVETLTDYRVKHGEAVAIGTVEEARLAVRQGLAPADWPERVAARFVRMGLPVALPEGLSFSDLAPVMRRDKKKEGGAIVRFALPCAPGDVRLVPVSLAADA